MSRLKVTFKPGALEEIRAIAPSRYADTSPIVAVIETGIGQAQRLAEFGLRALSETTEAGTLTGKRRAWSNDPAIVEFLGEAPNLGTEINLTVYRMAMVHKRLTEHELHVRLLPQDRASRQTTTGHNYGG